MRGRKTLRPLDRLAGGFPVESEKGIQALASLRDASIIGPRSQLIRLAMFAVVLPAGGILTSGGWRGKCAAGDTW